MTVTSTDLKEYEARCDAMRSHDLTREPCVIHPLVAEVRLLRAAVSGAVNEGWLPVERCESKMGPEVLAAILRALE